MNQKPVKEMTLREFARMGGRARAAKLSPERRSEIARLAVAQRERNKVARKLPSLEETSK